MMPDDSQIAVRLNHIFPSGLPTHAVQMMTVQNTEHEFFLSFYSVLFPPITGSDENRESLISELAEVGVNATCVARLSIAPGRIPEFINALEENLRRWRERDDTRPLEGKHDT